MLHSRPGYTPASAQAHGDEDLRDGASADFRSVNTTGLIIALATWSFAGRNSGGMTNPAESDKMKQILKLLLHICKQDAWKLKLVSRPDNSAAWPRPVIALEGSFILEVDVKDGNVDLGSLRREARRHAEAKVQGD